MYAKTEPPEDHLQRIIFDPGARCDPNDQQALVLESCASFACYLDLRNRVERQTKGGHSFPFLALARQFSLETGGRGPSGYYNVIRLSKAQFEDGLKL